MLCLSQNKEASSVTTSPILFPESELVTEPEEEQEDPEAEEEEGGVHKSADGPSLAESKLSVEFETRLFFLFTA